MSTGANRIFKIMQKSQKSSVDNLISVKVKSINPLTFIVDERLSITEDFIVFSNQIDRSKISVGDTFNAFLFNDGQTYYINQPIKTSSSVGVQDESLLTRIANLEKSVNSLTQRIKDLEEKEA